MLIPKAMPGLYASVNVTTSPSTGRDTYSAARRSSAIRFVVQSVSSSARNSGQKMRAL